MLYIKSVHLFERKKIKNIFEMIEGVRLRMPLRMHTTYAGIGYLNRTLQPRAIMLSYVVKIHTSCALTYLAHTL